MRALKVFVALLIVGFGLFVIINEQVTGASANAVVNAPVVTLRSEIAGITNSETVVVGQLVSAREDIGSVRDPNPDTIRRDDLELEVKLAQTELTRASRAVAQEESALLEISSRVEAFRALKAAELNVAVESARQRLSILQEAALLGQEPELPPDSTDLALFVQGRLAVALEIERTKAEIAVLEQQIDAATDSVFSLDGFNDAPVSEQQMRELELRLAASRLLLQRAEQDVLDIKQRLAQERVRAAARGEARLISPASGRVWEILSEHGSYVERGDPVVRIVNCDQLFVTLSVTENVFNTLSVGQQAIFRFSNTTDTYDARVARLAGQGAQTIYRNLAVAPSQKHLERFDVLVEVPLLNGNSSLNCPVGRTGRVFFERRPLDGIRRLFE